MTKMNSKLMVEISATSALSKFQNENILRLAFNLIPIIEIENSKHELLLTQFSEIIYHSAKDLFGPNAEGIAILGTFGELIFPNYEMGSISSFMHLEYRELVIFWLYFRMAKYYDEAIDLGANLGLHSIILIKAGFNKVTSYEPDPNHFTELNKRLKLNKCNNVIVLNAAVSSYSGKSEFTRVVGNTTSSHLSGLKPEAYGVLEKFEVEVVDIKTIIPKNSKVLIKIDIEGSELDVLSEISQEEWGIIDCVVEVTSNFHAVGIYELAIKQNLYIYSQKISWRLAQKIEDVPFNYKEGSIFITKQRNWNFPI